MPSGTLVGSALFESCTEHFAKEIMLHINSSEELAQVISELAELQHKVDKLQDKPVDKNSSILLKYITQRLSQLSDIASKTLSERQEKIS
jgi:hypothetical protein